jgi:hypothetical protein
MKSTHRNLFRIILFLLFGVISGNALAGNKVTICHIPPGNPDNAHAITISRSALSAHLAHGDTVGFCSSGSGNSTVASLAGPQFTICDDREGETGRTVNVSLVGRLFTERFECD